jgi:hypothetical protein
VPSSAERDEIKRLHAELKCVEQKRDILTKVVTIFLCAIASVMSWYQFIKQAATSEPVQVLCRVLHVSSAGYYQ